MAAKSAPLALGKDDSTRFLPWVLALNVYFAVIAVAGLVALEGSIIRWQDGAHSVVTVQLPAHTGSAAVNAAIDVMRRTPGIAGARPLATEEVVALLEPWLGAGNVGEDLPLPRLIDVTTNANAAVDWEEATTRLADRIPGAVIDTGMTWIEPLADLARAIQAVAAAVLVMVAAVAVVAVNYAARAGFAIHRNAIELMHLLGARDQHIAAQFQFQALAMAVRGGIVGFGLAAATVAVFGVVGGQVEAPLLPALRLGLGGWAALGAVPVATAVIAVFTARAIVHRALARMP